MIACTADRARKSQTSAKSPQAPDHAPVAKRLGKPFSGHPGVTVTSRSLLLGRPLFHGCICKPEGPGGAYGFPEERDRPPEHKAQGPRDILFPVRRRGVA